MQDKVISVSPAELASGTASGSSLSSQTSSVLDAENGFGLLGLVSIGEELQGRQGSGHLQAPENALS